MRTRQRVFEFLLEKQEVNGGYTGKDLTFLAEQLNVTPRGLRKRLSIWIKNDEDFSQFIYLGKEKPSMTLFEFFQIEQELATNPIQVKNGIYEDIQEQRRSENQKSLAKSTYYRTLKQKVLSMYCSETDNWFKAKVIPHHRAGPGTSEQVPGPDEDVERGWKNNDPDKPRHGYGGRICEQANCDESRGNPYGRWHP